MIDEADVHINANRELIERFEQKIQETIGRVWGEEAPDIL